MSDDECLCAACDRSTIVCLYSTHTHKYRIRKTRNYYNWHFSVNTFYWRRVHWSASGQNSFWIAIRAITGICGQKLNIHLFVYVCVCEIERVCVGNERIHFLYTFKMKSEPRSKNVKQTAKYIIITQMYCLNKIRRFLDLVFHCTIKTDVQMHHSKRRMRWQKMMRAWRENEITI